MRKRRQRFYYHLNKIREVYPNRIEKLTASVLKVSNLSLASDIAELVKDCGGKVNVSRTEGVSSEELKLA